MSCCCFGSINACLSLIFYHACRGRYSHNCQMRRKLCKPELIWWRDIRDRRGFGDFSSILAR